MRECELKGIERHRDERGFPVMETRVVGSNREVIIGDCRPTVLIGECINPSGRKKLSSALMSGNVSILQNEALVQIECGADIIDINVGLPGLDEVVLLPRMVEIVTAVVDAPISLDSSNFRALEAALKICRGKPLINSVTGKESSLNTVLPLAKDFGAVVIAMTMDDDGIPNDVDKRVCIASRIVEQAGRLGIPREDIIIDCVASPVGVDNHAGITTLETVKKVKRTLGLNMTLGCSNVSFGMPDRNLLNSTFLSMFIAAGVNCPIVNAAKVREIVLAADLALGRDPYAKRYTEVYRKRKNCWGTGNPSP